MRSCRNFPKKALTCNSNVMCCQITGQFHVLVYMFFLHFDEITTWLEFFDMDSFSGYKERWSTVNRQKDRISNTTYANRLPGDFI